MSSKATHPLLVDVDGHTECLLGNEAIVRGALEAGVAFAAGYPGTPSSEITDSFARLHREAGIVFEYSVNEKIALEMAFGASLAGARSICSMKHLGLMYAGDPLATIPYVGPVGGMVIVSAADPSCLTSPNEQDQRRLGPMLHIPIFDPGTAAEAKELTKLAFELSETCHLPVILRPTTRICHSRGMVTYGKRMAPRKGKFRKDPSKYNPIPVNARRMRVELKGKIEQARQMIARAGTVKRSGSGEMGILASGVPGATCADILAEEGMEDRVTLVTLGAVWPIPDDEVCKALDGIRKVLVVEELSGHLEDYLTVLAARRGMDLEILGKATGHFPEEFEYVPEVIGRGLRDGLGLEVTVAEPRTEVKVPPRPPVLCAGCPHTASYLAATGVFEGDQLYFNDIGCYSLGIGAPLETSDALLCMGAGFTLAASVARVTGERTVGFMGDSTFFHSGMPALMNAIKEDVNMIAVILDNQVTAMTGFQDSPTVSTEEAGFSRETSIEAVARAMGAPHVETIDPFDEEAALAAFRRARDGKGVSVIVSEHPCPNFFRRETGERERDVVYEIDPDSCAACWNCIDAIACPAFYHEDGRVEIDPKLCAGCGICERYCTSEAIYERPRREDEG